MLGHNSIENYYKTQFSLVQHHKYSLTELENMMPYELEIYVEMLINFLEEQKEFYESKNRQRKR